LRALATEGIQRGHMELHRRQAAVLERAAAKRNGAERQKPGAPAVLKETSR
jgi:hydroxymethylglutaryl-CoA reductase